MYKLRLKEATIEDCRLLYDLSMDNLVRKNSFNEEEFSFESHTKWFKNKIESNKFELFFFYQQKDECVGFTRFEQFEDHILIGVIITPNYRGRGLSAQIIKISSKRVYAKYKLPIFAQIKNENIRSSRAFEKAGYQFDQSISINSINAVQYKYEDC